MLESKSSIGVKSNTNGDLGSNKSLIQDDSSNETNVDGISFDHLPGWTFSEKANIAIKNVYSYTLNNRDILIKYSSITFSIYNTVTTILSAPYIALAVGSALVASMGIEYAITHDIKYSKAALGTISVMCGLGGAVTNILKGGVAGVKGLSAAGEVFLPGPLKIITQTISSGADLVIAPDNYAITSGVLFFLYELSKTKPSIDFFKWIITDNIRKIGVNDVKITQDNISDHIITITNAPSKAISAVKDCITSHITGLVVNKIADFLDKKFNNHGMNKENSVINILKATGETYINSMICIPQTAMKYAFDKIELQNMEKSFILMNRNDIETGRA